MDGSYKNRGIDHFNTSVMLRLVMHTLAARRYGDVHSHTFNTLCTVYSICRIQRKQSPCELDAID